MTWWYDFSTDLPDTGWTIGAESRGKSRWKLNWPGFLLEKFQHLRKLAIVRSTSSKSATLMPKAMAKTTPLSDTSHFGGVSPTSRGSHVRTKWTKGHHLSSRMMQPMCSHQTCPTARQQIPKMAKLREAEPWQPWSLMVRPTVLCCVFLLRQYMLVLLCHVIYTYIYILLYIRSTHPWKGNVDPNQTWRSGNWIYFLKRYLSGFRW